MCPIEYAGYINKYAKCTNLLYTIAWNIIILCQQFYLSAYKYFILPFLICLPFGKNKTRCECYTSWTARIKKIFQCPINCNGECTNNNNFTIKNDFALSIWVFKIAIFTYIFVAIVQADLMTRRTQHCYCNHSYFDIATYPQQNGFSTGLLH